MNIDWDNKPEWAIGAGYSAKRGWQWFDHSHYMSIKGGVLAGRYPFNTSFSKDDMTNIQLAYDNQPQHIDYLPPVGTECLMFIGDQLVGDQVLIMGYFADLVWVTVMHWDSEGDYSGFHKTFVINDNDGVKFQPIKTAREKFADDANKHIAKMYPEGCVPAFGILRDIYDGMMSGSIPIPKENRNDIEK